MAEISALPPTLQPPFSNSLPAEPFISVFGHKSIIIQVRIGAIHAVDFINLTNAERFVRVKTPDALKQALAVQHFVDAGNAAGIVMGRIEKSGVGVSDFDSPLQEFMGNGLARQHDASAFGVKLGRILCPHRPVAEQASDDSTFDDPAVDVEAKWRNQIDDYVVVVASVEGDVLAASFGDGPDDFKGLVPVEGGYLDGGHIFDFSEASPKRKRQHAPAGGRLKVKADQRDDLGNRAAVSKQFVVARALKRSQTEQPGLVAEFASEGGLGGGLLRFPADAGDSNRCGR